MTDAEPGCSGNWPGVLLQLQPLDDQDLTVWISTDGAYGRIGFTVTPDLREDLTNGLDP